MKTTNKTAVLSLVALGLIQFAQVDMAAAETAGPIDCIPGGNCYQYFFYEGSEIKDWETARMAAAAQISDDGVVGQLATLTSMAEDDFVRELGLSSDAGGEVWVGGFQEPGAEEPDQGWRWINGEGAIGANNSSSDYANWLANEPNEDPGAGGENFVGIGLQGYQPGDYGWNDEGRLGNIVGYVVEYGATDVPAESCLEGCTDPAGGLMITYPGNALIEPGATQSFTTFEFEDNACGMAKTFELDTDDDGITDFFLNRPAHLCGAPRFVAIVSESSGVSIPFGVVEGESEPSAYGLNRLACEPSAVSASNLLNLDTFGYQSLDPMDMVSGGGEEFTYDCGSSRGRFRGSIIPVGWYFFAGEDTDGYPNTFSDAFVESTLAGIVIKKIEFAIQSVRNAQDAGAIGRFAEARMLFWLKLAYIAMYRNEYELALFKIRQFNRVVSSVNYDADIGAVFNYNGEHVARGSNLEFTIEEKLVAFFD